MLLYTITTYLKRLLFLLLLVAPATLASTEARAQTQNTSDDTTLVVRKLRFSGNKFASSSVLETIVRSRTNRELFGLGGFTPWYWLWRAAPNIGEPPAMLDKDAMASDLQRITEYYRSNGYLEASARSSVVEYKPGKVEISFIIDEGRPSLIRNIYYSGVPPFETNRTLLRFYDANVLGGEQLSDTSFAVNKRLTFEKITLERERIIHFLKDQGYASVQNDSVTAELRRGIADQHQIDVLFRLRPGRVYQFADAEVRVVSDTETGIAGSVITDTIVTAPSVVPPNRLKLVKDASSGVDFSIMGDRLAFKPGERFNQSKYLRSVSRFQELGSFSVRRFALSEDGGLPNFESDALPVLIELQELPKHRIGFDLFGLQRYGFGAGAGVRYTNNNLAGSAENLELALRGNVEVYDQTILNSFEASTRYTLPRLLFPFYSLNNKPQFLDVRTSYSISYNQVRQLNFDINANIAVNNRFEIRHSPLLTSTLDLFDIELIDAAATQEFVDQLDERFQSNPQLIVFILEDFRPQVSSVIRYSLRRLHTDIIRRNYGSYQEVTVESAGMIPYLSDRFIVTPGTLEGDLPGIYLRSLDYTQFVKVTADFRRYLPLSSSSTFAYRAFAGTAFAYGVNDVIPITRRFFAGGSSDIRGWAPLKLGPGRAQDDLAFNGGDIKLLGQAEIRQRVLMNVLGGDLDAGYFVDAGNVWLSPKGAFSRGDLTGNTFRFSSFAKQIAVGAGAGLRIDWDYVILRFDMAFRIHDLERGWLNNKKAFLHFGVGHAF